MSVESICSELRKDPRNPDIVRLLKRLWELLVLYDETGIESYMGRMTPIQVGQEMLYVASKLEMDGLDKWIYKTSGMTELLFQWDAHSAPAVRAHRMEWLGEEASLDPEYALFRAEEGHQATRQFVPYLTTVLSMCAGIPAVQIKAVSRLINLTLDPVVWEACQLGLEVAMCTVAAMANPKSSFRDEFQKMGGLACVGLCYLYSDEPERQNVFDQVLKSVTLEEVKVLTQSLDNKSLESAAFLLLKFSVLNCFDLEIEDRRELIPSLFAKLYDCSKFREAFPSWVDIPMFRKDCPSAFLLFVSLKGPQLDKRFPKASKYDLGLLMALAFISNEAVRKTYQWKTYPETRKQLWRTARDAQAHIERAEEGIKRLGDENEIDWDALAKDKKVDMTEKCMFCGAVDKKLSRCGKCKLKWYCSTVCQSKDWQNKHKEWCGK